MIKVDYEKIAQKIVNKCMRVKQNEVIMVNGGIHNFELIEDIAVNIAKLGAFPLVQVNTDRLSKRKIEEVSEEFLRKPPKHLIKWVNDVHGIISIDSHTDPRLLSLLPEKKVNAAREGSQKVRNKLIKLNTRWTGIGYPTKEKAEMFSIGFEEFWDMFWKALNVDYGELYKRGAKIAELLKTNEKVKIFSEKGTHLEFSTKGRKILIDDGVISDEDIKNGDVGNNLPCGEIFVAPLENSANGRAVFDLAFYRGNKITDIDVIFRNGKLKNVKALENEELFKDVIVNSTGAKNIIGEFGIGINPEIHKAIGYEITDEKISGTIHIAIGENRSFGGKNSSPLHWDLVMMSPTVILGDKVLMKKGKFNI